MVGGGEAWPAHARGAAQMNCKMTRSVSTTEGQLRGAGVVRSSGVLEGALGLHGFAEYRGHIYVHTHSWREREAAPGPAESRERKRM